jgi:hypothetical protein
MFLAVTKGYQSIYFLVQGFSHYIYMYLAVSESPRIYVYHVYKSPRSGTILN